MHKTGVRTLRLTLGLPPGDTILTSYRAQSADQYDPAQG
jgi:hypothetical protein